MRFMVQVSRFLQLGRELPMTIENLFVNARIGAEGAERPERAHAVNHLAVRVDFFETVLEEGGGMRVCHAGGGGQ